MENSVYNSKRSIENYKKRTEYLLKIQRKSDKDIFNLEHEFEKKSEHFSSEIADIQTKMYEIKGNLKKLRSTINNILISLEMFAKKEQVEKLKELDNEISLLNYVTSDELKKMVEARMK